MKKLMYLMIVLLLVSSVQGVVHRWSFNGDASDSVGAATAVLTGATVTSTELDVSNGGHYAVLPVSSTLNGLTTEISVEGWMTPTHATPNMFAFYRAWLLGDGTSGAYLGGLQFIPTNGGDVMVSAYCINDGTGLIGEAYGTPAPTISQGTPFHFAVTYKQNGSQDLYYNGVLLNSDTGNPAKDKAVNDITYIDNAIRIGAHPAGPYGFPHMMDEFRIYGVELSAADVAANYAAGPDGAAIPEPASMILLGIGSLLALKRRKN